MDIRYFKDTPYFKVNIEQCSKASAGSPDVFLLFNEEVKTFQTVQEVRAFLAEQYSTHPQDVYVDKKQVGYVYYFDNADWSHAPVEHWWQRDIVGITCVTEEIVLLQEPEPHTCQETNHVCGDCGDCHIWNCPNRVDACEAIKARQQQSMNDRHLEIKNRDRNLGY